MTDSQILSLRDLMINSNDSNAEEALVGSAFIDKLKLENNDKSMESISEDPNHENDELVHTPPPSPTSGRALHRPSLFSLAQVSSKLGELWSSARESIFGEDYWIPSDPNEIVFFPSELLRAHRVLFPADDNKSTLRVVQGTFKNRPAEPIHHVVFSLSETQNAPSYSLFRSNEIEEAVDLCRRCLECKTLFTLLGIYFYFIMFKRYSLELNLFFRTSLLKSLILCGARRCRANKLGCVSGCVNEAMLGLLKSSSCVDTESPRMAHVDSHAESVEIDHPVKDFSQKVFYDSLINRLNSLAACNQKPKNMVNLLSMDGGGIRGLVIIQILMAIEEVLDEPIYPYFDWVAGTSTGALVATALAQGIIILISDLKCFNNLLIYLAPVDRSRSWCNAVGVPFFRLSAPLHKDIGLGTKDDHDIAHMMWDCVEYTHQQKPYLLKLCTLLKKIGKLPERPTPFYNSDTREVHTQTSVPTTPVDQ
uniref:PNPLA domain-containing protein n=1 Tax=Heterorhabditis bacteriophora TaxID=37862 RepID=A0A1I7X8E1_HETBA